MRSVWTTRYTALVVVVALLALSSTARTLAADNIPSPPRPGTYEMAITSGGFDRVAHLYIPKGYEPATKPPLVVTFHGAGGEGEMMLTRNGWAAQADKRGFLVISPTGLPALPRLASNFAANPNLWNSGQLRPRSPRAKIDDVEFTADLLDELQEKVPYDANRVYAAGHSNGASMTFRVGAELSERFAALGPVAGKMALEAPEPARPLPTLYIIGTRDPLQPLAGGEVKLPWGTHTNVPVAEFLTDWAKGMGCATEPNTMSDQNGVKRVEYPATNGGPTLSAIYIKGQGHEWPGGRSALPERLIGPRTDKLDATEVIWEFFAESQRGK